LGKRRKTKEKKNPEKLASRGRAGRRGRRKGVNQMKTRSLRTRRTRSSRKRSPRTIPRHRIHQTSCVSSLDLGVRAEVRVRPKEGKEGRSRRSSPNTVLAHGMGSTVV